MGRATYHVVCEVTEDRFAEVDGLDEAIRIARGLVREGQTDGPVSIEHDGRVVRQFTRTSHGAVEDVPVG